MHHSPLAPRPSVELVGRAQEKGMAAAQQVRSAVLGQQDERPRDGASRRGCSKREGIITQVGRAPGNRQGRRNSGWSCGVEWRRAHQPALSAHRRPGYLGLTS